jgi:hypothetical protein
MKIDRRMLLAGGLAAPFVSRAYAQTQWPTKPVRVISGGSAGGGSDISFRLVEARLRDKFGQPFIIENLTGAGGTTGAATAAKATDQHTFFISNVASNAIAESAMFRPETSRSWPYRRRAGRRSSRTSRHWRKPALQASTCSAGTEFRRRPRHLAL